jgi:hypothetical protein
LKKEIDIPPLGNAGSPVLVGERALLLPLSSAAEDKDDDDDNDKGDGRADQAPLQSLAHWRARAAILSRHLQRRLYVIYYITPLLHNMYNEMFYSKYSYIKKNLLIL